MKIICLNIWHGELLGDLRSFIKNHERDADAFCFQEMSLVDRERILENGMLGEFRHVESQKRTDLGGFEQFTFFKPSWKLTRQSSIYDGVKDVGGALIAKLSMGSENIFVCNVDGLPQPGEKLDDPSRLKQSRGIIEYLADKSGQKIIIGDFNLMPDTESIKMFEKAGYRNLIREYGITNTRNHYIWDLYPDTPQYYSDYAFVSPDVKVTNFEVLPEEVSDHQPLLLTIE